ncbi:MAG: MBG domain-containing protein [Lacunisphaera sp.]
MKTFWRSNLLLSPLSLLASVPFFSALLFAIFVPVSILQAQLNFVPPYYRFTTLAGHPASGDVDGSGNAARFRGPYGVAVDGAENVYVADSRNHTIRKIDSNGVVTTFAGSANAPGSADGIGTQARFNQPDGVAVDAAGNVYVADTANSTIRKITATGVVTTLAGAAGNFGSTDGTGRAALFSGPYGVAVDGSGNVYVADTGNHVIREITAAGVVTTIAGTAGNYGAADGTGSAAQFDNPMGIAVDGSNNIYVADVSNSTIRKIAPGGVVTTLAGKAGVVGAADGTGSAAQFRYAPGVSVDGSGNVYVADWNNFTIRKITPAGVVTTLAGLAGYGGATDGTGGAARFNYPPGVAVSSTTGNVYVADYYNYTIRKITSGGVVTTLAGLASSAGFANGTGGAAQFNEPQGVAVDGAGNVYVADTANHVIRKITAAGVTTTLAGTAGSPGSADGSGSAAQFNSPSGLAVDGSGNVYVADANNGTIRKITTSGIVSTFAGNANLRGWADGAVNLARFGVPSGVAVDAAGNVYVAETDNNTIRKISAGVVTTLAGSATDRGAVDGTGSAARFNYPGSVAVDSSGNVYVADTQNYSIRKITPAGLVTTFAGSSGISSITDGTGSAARFNFPTGVAVDSSGTVYVADSGLPTIRKITPAGLVTTLAGGGNLGSLDGVGASAQFLNPSGIALDGAGNLYVADTDNNVIRKGVSLPVIVLQSQARQVLSPGQSLTLSVTATGHGVLGYQWSHNGKLIPGASSGNYSLSNITVQAGGYYFVDVTDANGTTRGAPLFVSVGAAVTQVRAWGLNNVGQLSIPNGLTDAVAIAAGEYHSLALRRDGTVVTWGENSFATTSLPADLSGVVAIAAGDAHSLALKSDGTVVAWGFDESGDTATLANLTNAVAIAGGSAHSLALKSDGTVVAWGNDTYGQCEVPGNLNGVIALAAGVNHSLALKSDGTVVAWGDNSYGQSSVPVGLSGVVAIAAGNFHSLALKSDGTVVAWSNPAYAMVQVPTGLTGVVAIAAGRGQSLAVKSDGTIIGWGQDSFGEVTPPSDIAQGLAVSARGNFSVALRDASADLSPSLSTQPAFQVVQPNQAATLAVSASGGTAPLSYQWRKDGTNLSGAISSTLTLGNFTSADAGSYDVVVTDYLGSVTSSAAVVKVAAAITLSHLSSAYDGSPKPATAVTNPVSLPVSLTYNGSTTVPTNVGSYTVVCTVNTSIYQGSVTGSLVIDKGTAAVTLGSLRATYNGSAHAATATSTPASLGISFTYNGSIPVPINAGTYAVVGTINDTNYMGSASGSLVVDKASAILTWNLPATVPYGVVLDDALLNARASVPGTLIYAPGFGQILPVGTYTMSVSFTPTDATNYYSTTAFYPLNVMSSMTPTLAASGNALGDFDGDGKADLVWTNTVTGERSMWLMNGSGMKAGASLGVVPVEWVVSATADFDGDGKADIFWTNAVTGDRSIWLMDGSTMRSNTFMGTVPTDWVISGTGDFDGDGKKDLVWTNTTTGDRAMWLMNGSAVKGGGYLGAVPVEWIISGVGDFDGDGKADLIWSNSVTGEHSIWFQNGSTTINGATLNTVPVAWVISGVGDFNGDGKADVFLTNTVSGDRVIWLMNGSKITTNTFMGTVPVDWTISGTGDFNGDGKKDLVWTNTTTGDRAMWLLNGNAVTGGGYLGTVPVEWKINN